MNGNISTSVLLPFRNSAQTIRECIDSILDQNVEDMEVVAIDDCSDDSTADIIESYRDERIRLYKNRSKGLVAALNYGLWLCRSEFIARMDADDIMFPGRLQKQVEFLEDNSSVALVASQVEKFPAKEIGNGYREYVRWQNSCLSSQDISNQIYIESPLAHPSVMFRKNVIQSLGGYREGDFPEDYDLWFRLYRAGFHMEKIPEVLLRWRESGSRLSRTAPQYEREAFDRLRAKYLADDHRLKGRYIVYWGAGRKTRKRCQHLINRGYMPRAWIDIDPRKIGQVINGARVEQPEWLDRDERPFVLNYVTNHGARERVSNFLEVIGYERGRDYLEVG